MARPKKYIINLTEEEIKELKSTIRRKKTSKSLWILSQADGSSNSRNKGKYNSGKKGGNSNRKYSKG